MTYGKICDIIGPIESDITLCRGQFSLIHCVDKRLIVTSKDNLGYGLLLSEKDALRMTKDLSNLYLKTDLCAQRINVQGGGIGEIVVNTGNGTGMRIVSGRD